MRVMEARYQVSSVLFVASAHLGDKRHDEAIATPSALSYLNAVETFDATQEVAKMGAALRGDEVLGGALLNPELRNRRFFPVLRRDTFIGQTIRQ